MCSAPSMPEMPKMEPLPPPAPLPTPQQAAPPPPPAPPTPQAQVLPPPPMPPMNTNNVGVTPPPVPVGGMGIDDAPLIRRGKSKRQELQQSSSGTAALRIPYQTGIGPASGSTGATGLNIPK